MEEATVKRFKYTSYNEKISSIFVGAGRIKPSAVDKEVYDEDATPTHTPLTSELSRLNLLDLTVPFQHLQRTLRPLITSLPVTLLNLQPISTVFFDFYAGLKDGQDHLNSGLDSALYLDQALYETCLGETLPHLPETARQLLRVGALRALEPKLVERTYSTLSAILRTIAPTLLRTDAAIGLTWVEVQPYLQPKRNKSYIRNCVSDAWAGVVRKARAEGLNRLVDGMLEDHEARGMEAVWAKSLKGTNGKLTSRALPIFEILLDRLRQKPTDHNVSTISRVATALVHHCSSSTVMPIFEAVISRLGPLSLLDPGSSTPKLPGSTAMLEVLSTILFVRRGKRFPESLLRPTMLQLAALAPLLSNTDDAKWRRTFVSCVVGSLQAGKLAQWLSPGVNLIDTIWEALNTQWRFAFVNISVSLKWPGVEQFLLPHVARAAQTSLDSDPLPTLVLLNNLAEAGCLSGGLSNVQGGRWWQGLVTAIEDLFVSLRERSMDEIEDRRKLGLLLRLLSSLVPEGHHFAQGIVDLLDRTIRSATDATATAHMRTWRNGGTWNDAHVLGSILRCAEKLVFNPMAEEVFKTYLLNAHQLPWLFSMYYWNGEIMGSVASFVELWKMNISLSSHDARFLIRNLRSANSSLRLATLRILAATARGASNNTSVSPAIIWSLCLQIESSEISLKNVRERTTHIARLGRLLAALPEGADDDSRAMLPDVVSYLVAQLKVNFRPLYAETISALAGLAGQHGEIVWSAIWQEMEALSTAKSVSVIDLGVENPEWVSRGAKHTTGYSSGDEDEEADFVCHNLEKSRLAVNGAWDVFRNAGELDANEVSAQLSHDRLDVLNYEAQLLAALTAVPPLAENHSRVLVPAFFAVARQDVAEDADPDSPHLSTRQRQQRTASYLELLSKFANPKAVFRAAELHALYLSILCKGEQKLQGLALRCLMTYKSPNLLPYEENLRTLLDDPKFRDELARFSLGIDSEIINPQHREEVIPVTIRILYGIITSRRGRSSTAQGLAARKQAMLTSLSGCSSDELSTLIDLMLEPFQTASDSSAPTSAHDVVNVAGRQQLGFLTLLADLLRYLGPQTVSHWPRLIGMTIKLVRDAQKRLTHEQDTSVDAFGSTAEDETEEIAEPEKGAIPLRHIRSLGIKRLVQFVQTTTTFDFSPYLSAIFASIISPRLDKLEIENTQAPSGTLDLIAALAASPETALALVEYDNRTLPKVFACMTAVTVKPAVIGRVFDIVEALLEEGDSATTEIVLSPHIHPLLENVIGLVKNLKQSANPDIMKRLLLILSRLSAVVIDGQQAQQLASLLGPMLRQSNKQLPEKGKVNVLNTLQKLYAISPDFADPTNEFFTRHYELIANLFQTMFFPSSRRALVAVLEKFAQSDASLLPSFKAVSDINAYSARRLDEPDFDRRLKTFAQLNDAEFTSLPKSSREWLPLLRSALFFVQEPEELSIRTNASSLIQRFISLVGGSQDGPLVDALLNVIMPGLRRVLGSKVELVRNEVLQTLSHAIKVCEGLPVFAEMRRLLADGEEANFFVNLSHIQVHRRARALRRLRDACGHGEMRETTLSTIFLPVLEHIVAGSTDVSDHHLVNEAISTIGAISASLRWSKYNALIMRYIRLGKVRSAQQKLYIRVVSSIIDGFHFDLRPIEIAPVVQGDAADEIEEVEQADDGSEGEEPLAIQAGVLQAEESERITGSILTRLMPALSNFVAQKGDTDDSIRIPLALPTVKLASVLPGDSSSVEILRTITTISQILRSKEQDTRDIARDTICKITVFLGPVWLVRVLKEVRAALQRGPQKHVAAVVIHAMLVLAASEKDWFGLPDVAIEDAVHASSEVIWGESGKDVESEGFKTKMREVRGASSRGLDNFQLVSRLVPPSKISTILAPIREIMHASQAVKAMQHIDEALRRVALGLNANERIQPADILSLCYSLISGNSTYLKAKRKAPRQSKAADNYHVQMKRDAKEEVDFYALNAHKLVDFGLDLFVTAFRRGKFDFDDVDILARLGPLVDAVGNTLYSPTTSVLLLGLKATAAIVRCPIPQIQPALPVFVSNIMKVIKNVGGTAESEVAQTALKTLAVILRDCKTSEVSDTQLAYLLEVISPDFEEHDRQSAIFTILRAVVTRRFVVPEVFDLMDRVSSITVTSQSAHVQELCRGVLIQFLLDYPQGKGRLKGQMTFLARNLDYVFESGRVSVMELLAAVFTKFTDQLIDEYADLFFVALVTVLANDESGKCRAMAGALIQQLFGRMDERRQQNTAKVLNSWVDMRDDQAALASASLAVYALLAEDSHISEDIVQDMLNVIRPVIEESADRLALAEASLSNDQQEINHSLPLHALSAASKVIQVIPSAVRDLPLETITAHLLFPHDWVRFAAARILASILSSRSSTLSVLNDDKLLDIARKSCILLRGSQSVDGEISVVEPKLADQLVKLLWRIGRLWATPQRPTNGLEIDDLEDSEDEEAPTGGQPLPWLMSRMSFIAKHIIISRASAHQTSASMTSWTAPVMSILRFFAGVYEHFTPEQAKHFLPHTLNPVYRILDEGGDLASTEAGTGIDELRQLATEVRDFVQSKVGTTDFSRAWDGLRKRVNERREGRKDARNRLATADPKAWANRRDKRGVLKKQSKKRKAQAFLEANHQGRSVKRRSG